MELTVNIVGKIKNVGEMQKEFSKVASKGVGETTSGVGKEFSKLVTDLGMVMGEVFHNVLNGTWDTYKKNAEAMKKLSEHATDINKKSLENQTKDATKEEKKRRNIIMRGLDLVAKGFKKQMKKLWEQWGPLAVAAGIFKLSQTILKDVDVLSGKMGQTAAFTGKNIGKLGQQLTEFGLDLKDKFPLVETEEITSVIQNLSGEGLNVGQMKKFIDPLLALTNLTGSADVANELGNGLASLVKSGRDLGNIDNILGDLSVGFGNKQAAKGIQMYTDFITALPDTDSDKFAKGMGAASAALIKAGPGAEDVANFMESILKADITEMPAAFASLHDEIKRGDFSGVIQQLEHLAKTGSADEMAQFAKSVGVSDKMLQSLKKSTVTKEFEEQSKAFAKGGHAVTKMNAESKSGFDHFAAMWQTMKNKMSRIIVKTLPLIKSLGKGILAVFFGKNLAGGEEETIFKMMEDKITQFLNFLNDTAMWENIKESIMSFGQELKVVFVGEDGNGGVWGFIKGLKDSEGLMTTINMFKALGETFKIIWNHMENFLKDPATIIKDWISGLFTGMMDGIEGAITRFVNWYSALGVIERTAVGIGLAAAGAGAIMGGGHIIRAATAAAKFGGKALGAGAKMMGGNEQGGSGGLGFAGAAMAGLAGAALFSGDSKAKSEEGKLLMDIRDLLAFQNSQNEEQLVALMGAEKAQAWLAMQKSAQELRQ